MSGSSAFDQGGGGMFHMDPLSFALAGAAQAMGQASQPSRLPAGIGSTIGMGAGGFAQGLMGGQQYQHMGLQNQAQELNNQLLKATIPSKIAMLNAASQYWTGGMGGGGPQASGGGAMPFGVPASSGGGVGGATQASTGSPRIGASMGGQTADYLLSPAEIKANLMFAMASGQDAAAARFAGLLDSMAGPGHAFGRSGNAFAIPGSVGDPNDIYARETATKQAGVGPELAIAGGKSAYEPPVTIDVPDGQGGFQKVTLPRPNLPGLIGGQQQPGQDTSQSGGGALWQRNNNPGNIRFVGQPGAQQGAGGFAAFPDMQTGAAAIYDQLQHYQQRGLTTLSQMVSTYAPPSENDTAKYITNLSLRTGIAPNQPVNLQDPQQARKIVDGIMQQETGGKFGLANLGQPAAAGAQPQNGLSVGAKGGGVQPAAFQAPASPMQAPSGQPTGGAMPAQAGVRLPPGAIPGPPMLTPQQAADLKFNTEATGKQMDAAEQRVAEQTKESQDKQFLLGTTQTIRDLASGVRTGVGADELMTLSRGFTALGMDQDAVKKLTGMNPADGEALNKMLVQLSTQAVRAMGAREPGSVISLFLRNYPNIESRPETIDLLTRVLDMDQVWHQDRTNAMQDYLQQSRQGAKASEGVYRGLGGFDKQFSEQSNPRVYMATALAAAGRPQEMWAKGLTPQQVAEVQPLGQRVYPDFGQNKPAPQPTSAAQQRAPSLKEGEASVAIRPTSREEIEALPKGTRFIWTDGRIHVRN